MFAQANGSAVVDAGRYLERNGLFFGLSAFAATDRTDFFGNLTTSMALWADSGLLDVAEDGAGDCDYLTRALTLVTGFEIVPWLDCRALTVFTGIIEL